MQQTDYYPFGMPMQVATNPERQPFKYGGKEFDTLHGINLYDFHARQQYPALGIFTSVDSLAEKYPWVSPYAYCLNNPLKYVDPDGKEIIKHNVVKRDNSGQRLSSRTFSNKMESALTDLMKVESINNFFSKFASKGQTLGGYTFTENGIYSQHELYLMEYSLSQETANITTPDKYGSFRTETENGETFFILNVFSINAKDKYEIGETIVHEIELHGYNIDDKINGGKAISEDIDHKALKIKDSTHKGYKQYNATSKELFKIDNKYRSAFDKAEENAQKLY